MVDYFARQAGEEPIVVRFNGGAQAGHTVCTPEGDRHVFHSYGAGTLAGARTYLARTCVINPVLWAQEWRELFWTGPPPLPIGEAKAMHDRRYLRTRIFVDREAPVTTVYDMLLNQHIESQLSEQRHGSCGAGIHKTMVRQLQPELRLFAADLESTTKVRTIVGRIREQYKVWDDIYSTDEVFERFVADCEDMAHQINVTDSRMLAKREVIFEGAQGLLLDQDQERFFPHVTHSKTGLCNALAMAEDLQIWQLDACYVTRSYVTRHGAGELPSEDPRLEYFDNTNVTNPWQGRLRFAPMSPENEDLISRAIMDDLSVVRHNRVNVTARCAMTHIDQQMVKRSPPWPLHYTSTGPTWKDVKDQQRR